jgi:cbb3-type cytochrome oxidase subunit 3
MVKLLERKIANKLSEIWKHLWHKILQKVKGGVLVEFAFSAPLLVMVMFFALDVPLAYRISAKLQKTSELYAQMLLNTVEKKPFEGLNEDDLKNISKAVGLTFTGVIGSDEKPNSQYPFSMSTHVTCIKCDTSGSFAIKWSMHIENDLRTGQISSSSNDYAYSVNISKNNITSFMGSLKSFKTYKGEFKLLVETIAWYNDTSGRGFNQKFYLLAIPGKIQNDVKILGDRYAVITPGETLNLGSWPVKVAAVSGE